MHLYSALSRALQQLPRQCKTLMLAVDGRGGSGKTTFSKLLVSNYPGSTLVHMDDFFRPSNQRLSRDIAATLIGADFDWERMRDQVLLPVSENRPGQYQRYDWDSDTLAEWHPVSLTGMLVVEGTFSSRKELTSLYDVVIWVDCPRSLRLQRGMARDGEAARERWQQYWMPEEERYIENHKPHLYADLIIDGSQTPQGQSMESAFTCLKATDWLMTNSLPI